MAKLVQLKQNGVEVFPRTVSNAVAVEAKNRLLSTVLTDVETEALGWSIKPTTEGSTLSYTLYKTTSEAGVTGETAVSTFTVAQDIYLDQVYYVADSEQVPSGHTAPGTEFPYLLMVFNTAANKQDLWISVKDLVDIYTADGSGITETNGVFSIEVDEATGNILTKSDNGLLVTIAATGDTYVSAAIDANEKNKVVVSADVAQTFSAVMGSETASGQLADAAQVKKYIDDQVGGKNVSATTNTPDYIDATADDNTVTVDAKIGTITGTASALTGTQGIADAAATATAVKNYVDGRVLAEKERVDALTATKGASASTYGTISVTTESGNVSNVALTLDVVSDNLSAATATGKLADAKTVKDYVDAQIGGKDAGVTGTTDFITFTVEEVDGALTAAGITAITQNVADASESAQGLAEASDVKGYVDDQVSALSISATGDTWVNAAVDATNNKKINVSTNRTTVTFDGADSSLTINGTGLVTNEGATAIKNYIDAKTEAEIAALDAGISGSTTDGFISITVEEVNGKLSAATVTDVVQAVATASSSAKGLAEASDVKAYVDGKVEALDSNVSDTEMGITVAVDQENGVVSGLTLTVDAITDSAATGSWAGKFVDAQTIKDYVDTKSAGVTILDTDDIDATVTSAGTTLAINFEADGVESGSTLAVKSGDVFLWGVTAEDRGTTTVTDASWPAQS